LYWNVSFQNNLRGQRREKGKIEIRHRGREFNLKIILINSRAYKNISSSEDFGSGTKEVLHRLRVNRMVRFRESNLWKKNNKKSKIFSQKVRQKDFLRMSIN